MLFRVRVIISRKHLAKIQKREFTFMKWVNKDCSKHFLVPGNFNHEQDTCWEMRQSSGFNHHVYLGGRGGMGRGGVWLGWGGVGQEWRF
jgi:hypothetical protein